MTANEHTPIDENTNVQTPATGAERADPEITIRPARPDDISAITELIRGLAQYEKLEAVCLSEAEDEDRLREHLFGERPCAEVLIGEVAGSAHPVGFALYFTNYSTFLKKPGIYLEDLFVEPEFRGRGLGKALLGQLIELARKRDCGRVEWSVLDWNESAIEFYKKSFGAQPVDGWTVFRVIP